MKFIKPLLIFLLINFSALGFGVLLMGDGPTSVWYTSMNQAPWTPPNWVFGTAWSFIMLCFSIYMTLLYKMKPMKDVITLFGIQFVLNVLWNFIFFNQHLITLGLIIIIALTGIVTVFLIKYLKEMKIRTLLLLPYFIWICIATSLNLYILVYN